MSICCASRPRPVACRSEHIGSRAPRRPSARSAADIRHPTPPEGIRAMPARKGQGQWALGYREPLNPNERSKRDNDGLKVRQRIIDIYQHTGFAGIDPSDLRGRFRWYGLYTQRREGIPGGKTATLEPEELEAEYFMLRIRIDGGALTTTQL